MNKPREPIRPGRATVEFHVAGDPPTVPVEPITTRPIQTLPAGFTITRSPSTADAWRNVRVAVAELVAVVRFEATNNPRSFAVAAFLVAIEWPRRLVAWWFGRARCSSCWRWFRRSHLVGPPFRCCPSCYFAKLDDARATLARDRAGG